MHGGDALSGTLLAGAARRVVNPPLGTRQTGFRLFGNPVQAIESDLTATALVLGDGSTKVVVIAIDLSIVGIDISLRNQRPAQEMRVRVADALGIPVSHVLLNTSHAHSGVALPDYMPDTPEQMALKERYRESLARGLVDAAVEAAGCMQPAQISCGWGESTIGVYRRETRDDRDVLGEVPDHPIDPTVGVIRVDDLDGNPIAVAFRYSCHPVTMGPRSAVVSSDFPGVARSVVENSIGGLALFLQGGGGNINPRAGMGLELDCRDTKNRVGLELGGEVVRVAAGIRTSTKPGARRPLGNVPDILFTPWEPVDGRSCTHLAAAEATVALDYVDLPPVDDAEEILAGWQATLEERRARRRPGVGGARRGEVRGLGAAPRRSRAPRPGDLRSLSPGHPSRRDPHRRHERRALLRDRARDPRPLAVSATRSPSATRTARSGTCRAPRITRRAAGISGRPMRCRT